MSNFVVSARKYRPLRFDEVVGQEHITTTLKNALMSDHLAHAFLFCGPRGIGKTSCARILAKALNCQDPGPDREPCNQCRSCTSFNEMASMNIVELDAASNNKVEHIRALNEKVRFQPQEGQYKVFIIDEVHMLTTAAFNAFLKTLEEPPPYAVFILATTEKQKILPTILSRCQIYDFHRIGINDIAAHLKSIAEKENIKAEDEALRLIAMKADGALRDALSLFDRIATVSEEGMTYQVVIDQLNILDYDYFFKFVDAFLEEAIEKVFTMFDEVLSKGFDGDLFLIGLGDHFRQLLMAQSPETLELIEAGQDLRTRYIDQAKKIDKSRILTALSLINNCDIHYPQAKNKRLHVEICLSRLCYMGRAIDAGEAMSEKKKIGSGKRPEVQQKASPEAEKVSEPKSKEEPPPTRTTDKKEPVKSSDKTSGVATKLKTKVKVPTVVPKLTSIEDLEKAVEEKSEKDSGDELPTLNDMALINEWQSYMEKIPTQSLKKIFEMSEIGLDENQNIRISVSSSIARDGILQETKFIQDLRTNYGRPDLSINVIIDEEKAQAIKDQNQRPATFTDKYKAMLENNPELANLVQRFQLKPDNE